MTRLVKQNCEYVRLTDWEGHRPRRKRANNNITRLPSADIHVQQSKGSPTFAFNEKIAQANQVHKERYADLTPVSNAAWKPLHGLLSRVMDRSRLRKPNDARQAASEPLLLKIPVELHHMIVDHLSPIDRTVLRYTCRMLYYTIRTAVDDFSNFEEDKLAKMRVAARLLGSDLCPRIKDSTGTRYLTREELVTKLRAGSSCKLCQEFWPGEGNNPVRCPFHAQMPSLPRRSALSSSMRRAINPFSWRRPYWERHPPSSFDEYVNVIKKEASRVDPGQCNQFSASYIASWTAALLRMETTLYAGQHNSNVNSSAPTAHGALLDGSSSSSSPTPLTPPAPVNEIVTLTCCSHCMNVIDLDAAQSCSSCGCTQCGWTDMRILRFPESVQGGFRVRYIPLGEVAGSSGGGGGGGSGGRRRRLLSRGPGRLQGQRGKGSGRLLYGTLRFARRGS